MLSFLYSPTLTSIHLKLDIWKFLASVFFSFFPPFPPQFPSFLPSFFRFLSIFCVLQFRFSNVSLWLASVKLHFDKDITELMLKFFIATYHVVYDFSLPPFCWCFFWQIVQGDIYQFFPLLVSISLLSYFIFYIFFFPFCLLCQADFFLLYL